MALVYHRGTEDQTIASANRPLDKSQWHQVLVEVQGGRFRVLIDGEQALATTEERRLPPGVIGFGCVTGNVAFDDVTLTPLPPANP